MTKKKNLEQQYQRNKNISISTPNKLIILNKLPLKPLLSKQEVVVHEEEIGTEQRQNELNGLSSDLTGMLSGLTAFHSDEILILEGNEIINEVDETNGDVKNVKNDDGQIFCGMLDDMQPFLQQQVGEEKEQPEGTVKQENLNTSYSLKRLNPRLNSHTFSSQEVEQPLKIRKLTHDKAPTHNETEQAEGHPVEEFLEEEL